MNRSLLIQYAYWIVITALLILLHSYHGADSDEGIVLEGAWNVLNGREIYIDSFQFVTPASFYFVSWIWQMLWPDYYLAKILGIVSILFTAIAIYRISKLIINNENLFTYIAPLLYCLASVTWPTISYNTFNVAFLAWATYFCLKWLSSDSLFNMTIAGFLTGLSILVLQHKGFAFFIAVLFFFLISYNQVSKDTRIKGIVLYVFFSFIPLIILFKWPISILSYSLVVFPLLNYIEVSLTSYVPWVFAVWIVTLFFIRLSDELTSKVKFLFIVQLALLMTALQRTDLSHTLIVMFPILSMTAVLYAKTERVPLLKLMRYAYISTSTIVITFLVTTAALHIIAKPPFHDEVKDMPLMKHIRNNCNTFYAGPFLPGLYFEARSLNPTFYPFLIKNMNTTQQFVSANADLQITRPLCIITAYAMAEKFNYDRENPVDKFIQKNYRISYEYGEVQVHIPRD